MFDIIVIGAGTAGLTAAIYGVRAGKKVLVFEENIYGGRIVKTPKVENYPGIDNVSGADFAMQLYEQARKLGVEIEYKKVVKLEDKDGIKIVHTEYLENGITLKNEQYKCYSTIIATGEVNRTTGLAEEVKYIGKGISYCATCDGIFYKGKTVAVYGGGNTALTDSLFLSEYCEKIYIIHRREEFRAEENLIKQIKYKENIEFVLNNIVTGFFGENILDSVEVENVLTKVKRKLRVNGVFIAIGSIPVNDAFSNVVELDKKGYIIAKENCKTSKKGVFCAGDCRTKELRQLTTATADGSVAAIKACEYINEISN